jgi:hypothetical protein
MFILVYSNDNMTGLQHIVGTYGRPPGLSRPRPPTISQPNWLILVSLVLLIGKMDTPQNAYFYERLHHWQSPDAVTALMRAGGAAPGPPKVVGLWPTVRDSEKGPVLRSANKHTHNKCKESKRTRMVYLGHYGRKWTQNAVGASFGDRIRPPDPPRPPPLSLPARPGLVRGYVRYDER